MTNQLWWAAEIKVIAVKTKEEGDCGPYNKFTFFLADGIKIGEITECDLNSKRINQKSDRRI